MEQITYRFAERDEEAAVSLRLEMLKIVNRLPPEADLGEAFTETVRAHLRNGDQATILAFDGKTAVGCAAICFFTVSPTVSHPTGKRALLMHVYTKAEYRRKGIAREMLRLLTDEARARGVTQIKLDATEAGRPLYEALGFTAAEGAMELNLSPQA